MLKKVYGVLIAAATVLLLVKAADRISRRLTLPQAPEPNGYVELVRIGAGLEKLEREPSEMTREETVRVAEAERAKLERAGELVRTNCAVPLQAGPGWGDRHAEEIKDLKRLALGLALQARALELAGQTNGAAWPLVNMAALGQAMTRGGIYVDGVNGMIVETLGAGLLRAKAGSLDAETCRSVARELENFEDRREPPEAILEREQLWSHASFGLISRVGGVLRRNADAERRKKFVEKHHDCARRTRRLMMALAARAVELETKQRPSTPAGLAPAVLRRVPLDPATKREMTELPASESER